MRVRIRAGDPDAFRRLFDEHARAVYRYAVRLTGDPMAAEDVVSLTFLEAWRLRGRLRQRPEAGPPEAPPAEPPEAPPAEPPEAPPAEPHPHSSGDGLRPWLLGIATNVLRNASRARRRHRAAMARLPAPHPVPDFADELVERLARATELAAAHAALARLRRAEREVIALCVWSGLDYAATAEALSIPVGTVRSRLSRARAKLRGFADAELAGAGGGVGPEREPGSPSGQVTDDRVPAVRSSQGRNA